MSGSYPERSNTRTGVGEAVGVASLVEVTLGVDVGGRVGVGCGVCEGAKPVDGCLVGNKLDTS